MTSKYLPKNKCFAIKNILLKDNNYPLADLLKSPSCLKMAGQIPNLSESDQKSGDWNYD